MIEGKMPLAQVGCQAREIEQHEADADVTQSTMLGDTEAHAQTRRDIGNAFLHVRHTHAGDREVVLVS